MPSRILAAFVLVTAAACDPTPEGSVRALVTDFDGVRYAAVVRPIETLDEASALEGSVATVHGAGNISLGVPAGLRNVQAFRDAMLADAGDAVRPRWTTVEDALYPRDFDAFALTSLYHHIERAAVYYEELGVSLEAPLPVYYLPYLYFQTPSGPYEFKDNVLYFFGVGFLAVTRFDRLQTLPLGMNRGVVVHEYGHAIFDHVVYDDASRVRLLTGDLDDRTGNLLRSTTEGLSDFFGADETGDPDFLHWSVPLSFLGRSRSVLQPLIYDEATLASAETIPEAYDPYLGGTCLASALYRLEVDRPSLRTAIRIALEALRDRITDEPPWNDPPEDFGFAWLLDPLVEALPADDRAGACDVFSERLPAAHAYMSACP